MVIEYDSIALIVNQYIETLKKRIRIDKVILFGSSVRGTIGQWSDIDLAVVSPDFGQNVIRDMEFLSLTAWEVNSAIEALAYTPDEYERADHQSFLGEIKRTGKLVYESKTA